MKTVPMLLVMLLCSLAVAHAAESEAVPVQGDAVARVTELLGEPQGYMRIAGLEVFLYERGRVEARDGVVTAVDLLSHIELAAYRVEQQRIQAQQERERRERLREGLELRDRMLTDPAFAARPLADRLAFWQSFRHRYPGAGGGEEYTRLFHERQRELDALRIERQLAELERRTREAEARARRAERQAVEARLDSARRVHTVIAPAVHPVIYTHWGPPRRSTTAHGWRDCPRTRHGSSIGVRYASHPYGWHGATARPSSFSISYRRSR